MARGIRTAMASLAPSAAHPARRRATTCTSSGAAITCRPTRRCGPGRYPAFVSCSALAESRASAASRWTTTRRRARSPSPHPRARLVVVDKPGAPQTAPPRESIVAARRTPDSSRAGGDERGSGRPGFEPDELDRARKGYSYGVFSASATIARPAGSRSRAAVAPTYRRVGDGDLQGGARHAATRRCPRGELAAARDL